MGPDCIVVRLEPVDGPARRLVCHARLDGWELERQWWRTSLGEWQTTETELLEDVTVSAP